MAIIGILIASFICWIITTMILADHNKKGFDTKAALFAIPITLLIIIGLVIMGLK